MYKKENSTRIIKFKDIISLLLIIVLLSNLTIVFATKKTSTNNKDIVFKDTEGIHNKYNVEWWYFNFNLDEGYSGYVTILKGRFNRRPHDDYIAFVQLSQKNKVILKTSLLYNECKVSEDKLNIEFKGYDVKKEGYTILMKSNHKTEISTYNVIVNKSNKNIMELSMKQKDIQSTGLRLGKNGKIEIFPGIKDSYYYTLTNLSTTLKYNNGKREIKQEGKAWFDHQYFKVTDLKKTIQNLRYDWFSIQIDNGTKKMEDDYQIIVMDSYAKEKSKKYIAIIDGNGNKKEAEDLVIKKTDNKNWSIVSKKLGIDLKITSKLDKPISRVEIPERFRNIVGASALRFYEANTIVKNKEGKQVGVGFIESTNNFS